MAPRLERSVPQPLVLDPGGRPGIPRTQEEPVSELDQKADRTRQLAVMIMGSVDSKGGCAGEVTANLGTDLEVFIRVPVGAQGHLFIVGVDAGSSALDVVEPLGTTEGVDFTAEVQDVDEVNSIPGAG